MAVETRSVENKGQTVAYYVAAISPGAGVEVIRIDVESQRANFYKDSIEAEVDMVMELAHEAGYENPMIVFDKKEAQKFLKIEAAYTI